MQLSLSVEQPPTVSFEDADLSEMARVYAENKRVSNKLIKSELGVNLACQITKWA